ncbi:hypothetical protein BLNAU_18235 [Blattamonas nauphoetae]|uniref:Uncharacterized protein n=1 Tax=Blattamonas nauphoetae TaxID=2049346 RepID=A0ABQ9X9B6_9EUKA|nr:hypothetical protein BLNAU_18235 [Blattamonas nauphoetae]
MSSTIRALEGLQRIEHVNLRVSHSDILVKSGFFPTFWRFCDIMQWITLASRLMSTLNSNYLPQNGVLPSTSFFSISSSARSIQKTPD